MAKVKKLSAMRGKSSKRRKVSTKPDRKNEAKRPLAKKSKFKFQRASTGG